MKFGNTLLSLIDRLGNLIYPMRCLHCSESQAVSKGLFCPVCLQQLVPIDPETRCPFCFGETESCALSCTKAKSACDRIAAVYDYLEAPATLVKKFKYGGQFYLANGIGALMTTQFLKLQWPMPDYIVPMPIPFLKKVERGYNQSYLIAQVIAKLLERPLKEVVKRASGDYSQAGLTAEKRHELSNELFSLVKGHEIYDKRILLIDDVCTTGSSLKCSAEVIKEGCPKEVRALCFCKA